MRSPNLKFGSGVAPVLPNFGELVGRFARLGEVEHDKVIRLVVERHAAIGGEHVGRRLRMHDLLAVAPQHNVVV